MKETIYIYGLFDDSKNELVYVGKTKNPHSRLCVHKSKLAKGFKDSCRMEILDSGEHIGPADESFWINYARSLGCNLLNTVTGKAGYHYYVPIWGTTRSMSVRVPTSRDGETGIDGSKVCEIRLAKGLSRVALGKCLNRDREWVSKLENMSKPARLRKGAMDSLAKFLGVDLADISRLYQKEATP